MRLFPEVLYKICHRGSSLQLPLPPNCWAHRPGLFLAVGPGFGAPPQRSLSGLLQERQGWRLGPGVPLSPCPHAWPGYSYRRGCVRVPVPPPCSQTGLPGPPVLGYPHTYPCGGTQSLEMVQTYSEQLPLLLGFSWSSVL